MMGVTVWSHLMLGTGKEWIPSETGLVDNRERTY